MKYNGETAIRLKCWHISNTNNTSTNYV